MPEHHRHRHGHKSSHRHSSSQHGRDPGKVERTPKYHWEWFWACCYCRDHAGMSTIIIIACPGCQHIRCNNCPVETLKVAESGSHIVSYGSSYRGGATSWTSNRTGPVPGPSLNGNNGSQQTRTPLSPTSGPAVCLDVATSDANGREFTTSSTTAPVIKQPNQSPTPRGAGLTNNVSRPSTSQQPMTRHPSTSTSTSYSRRPSISFSQQDSDFDSATDLDVEDSESDWEGSDGSVSDEVGSYTTIWALDVHLLSVLRGDFDLSARLLHEIHEQFNRNDEADFIRISKFGLDLSPNDGGGESSKGKERASEYYSSPLKQSSGSGSSPRKHGRGSENTPGNEPRKNNNPNKRSRRGKNSDRGQGDDGGTNPSDAPDRSPDDPDEDPGNDPSIANGTVDPPDYACHFHKRDPNKYSPYKKKYAKCVGSCITKLRRIKYHFKQVHRVAQCYRCYLIFQDQTELKVHCQIPEGCLMGLPSLKEGIDNDQWDKIDNELDKKGQKHVSDFDRWYTIWDILFPDIEPPSNPWNVPPGDSARPVYVEDVLLSFQSQIQSSQSERILQPDENIPERYLIYLRQTLQEFSDGRGMIQLQGSGKNSENQVNTLTLGNHVTANTDRVSSDSQPCLHLRRETMKTWSSGSGNTSSAGNPGESQMMGSWDLSDQSVTSMNRPWISNSNRAEAAAAPLNANPTFDGRGMDTQPFDPHVGFNEGLELFDAFWENGNAIGPTDALEYSSASQYEPDQNVRSGDSSLSEEMALDRTISGKRLEDRLQEENEMTETLTWNDKHSGNQFLEQL